MKITADEFNERYPIGTPVRYWPVLPAGPDFPPRDTKTRTPAWQLSDGRPLVSVDGQAGGVALSHIEIRKFCTCPRDLPPVAHARLAPDFVECCPKCHGQIGLRPEDIRITAREEM